MIDFFQSAMSLLVQAGKAKVSPQGAVTFKFDGRSPEADKIRKLVAKLSQVRRITHENGVVSQEERAALPGAEEELRELVRDLVGHEAYDAAMARASREPETQEEKAQAMLAGLSSPAAVGGLVSEAFKHRALSRESMAPHDATRLLNKAEEQARTGKKILDQAGGA